VSVIIPQLPVKVEKPNDFASDYEKFAHDGEWFLKMGRWLVLNYYNTYSVPNSYMQPFSNTGLSNGGALPVTSSYARSTVDEALDNYAYFFGTQDNRIFNHLTVGVNNNPLPNVWLKGQEVRQLTEHLIGKAIQLIQPIEKNISADTISYNTVLKRQEIFDKIDVAPQARQILSELGGEAEYAPAGEIDYANPDALKEAKRKIKGEYESTATVITRHAYYACNLKEKFISAAQDTPIANLAGIEFTEKHGRMLANYIPSFQLIFDYSTWGEYGEAQTKVGYIIPSTLEEILSEYPDMNPLWVNEIKDVLYNGVDGSSQFMEYYNQPFQNVLWWYNDQKWISKAVVYWLSEAEVPYMKKTNKYGGKKIQKIDAYRDYQIPAGEKDGKMLFDKKKGHELDDEALSKIGAVKAKKIWKWHKAVIIGNKYLVEYGYDTFQVRPFGDKTKPASPIQTFCQGKIAGYVKSVVSRVKSKQEELDAVRYRLREYTAQDLGINRFFRGGKLGEGLNMKDIINDLRAFHITVIPETGNEFTDKLGIRDLVHTEDMSNHAYIREYLTLKADILKEMKDILNISDVALGEQTSTIGKGVQSETIARSEISSLPYFTSLSEYFRRVLQYAANKNKMILLAAQDKKVILPVSQKEVELLEMTKEFNYEDLNVYLEPDDQIAVSELGLFKQMMMSYSQNPTLEHAEAMVNALKMMRNKSFTEGIAMFEDYVSAKKKEMEQAQLRQAVSQQQQMQFEQLSAQNQALQAQMANLMTELAKISAKGAWSVKEAEVKSGLDRQYQMDDALIQQITGLVQQQMGALQQPQVNNSQ
jgi:cell division protein FtsB